MPEAPEVCDTTPPESGLRRGDCATCDDPGPRQTRQREVECAAGPSADIAGPISACRARWSRTGHSDRSYRIRASTRAARTGVGAVDHRTLPIMRITSRSRAAHRSTPRAAHHARALARLKPDNLASAACARALSFFWHQHSAVFHG